MYLTARLNYLRAIALSHALECKEGNASIEELSQKYKPAFYFDKKLP